MAEDLSTTDKAVEQKAQPKAEAKPGRLISLDAFRGLTIVLMLLVNNIAVDTATPRQLTHAPWNGGVRAADLVFPWFLFCVGVAMPFSAASFRRSGLTASRYVLKAVGRAAALIALGFLVDSSIYRQPVFAIGVLQLIGLAYLAGALLYRLPTRPRLGVAFALLLGYWVAIKFTQVPGAIVGTFEEQQNFITHINRTYLSSLHLDGLLSVIPTAAMVLIASAIGDMLRRDNITAAQKSARLIASGIGLAAIGLLWNLHLPFNKPVWTSSYIVFTAGTAALVLGLLHFVIDARGWRQWAFPLIVFGSNAILAYVAPILVKVHILQEWAIGTGSSALSIQRWWLDSLVARWGRVPGGWAYTLGYIAIWWLVLWILYRKKIFLKV